MTAIHALHIDITFYMYRWKQDNTQTSRQIHSTSNCLRLNQIKFGILTGLKSTGHVDTVIKYFIACCKGILFLSKTLKVSVYLAAEKLVDNFVKKN